MNPRALLATVLCACCLGVVTGCSVLQPAEPIGADQQYVCQAGSGLKHRKPRSQTWPDHLLPRAPSGSCMHR